MKKKMLSLLCSAAVTLSLAASMPLTANSIGRGDFYTEGNQNGVINTFDVREMMKKLAVGSTLTEKLWGDYNVDGVFNTSDARAALAELMVSEDVIVREEAVNNFAKPTDSDWWGENSVNVLGDSISFGVGTSNNDKPSDVALITGGIPERSYISYVKKAVQNANGGKMNYGFTSAYPTAWPGVARSDDLHCWPDYNNTEWGTDVDDGNRLMSVGMTCSTAGYKTITYRLRKDYYQQYRYFCVYYDCVPDGGMFVISDGAGHDIADVKGSTLYTNTKSSTRQTKRTEFYDLNNCPKDENGIPKIVICKDDTTNPVTITGIGYYKTLPKDNNADGYVTFNSFTRGGVSLINLSDTVLRQAAAGDTLILGLGYNDCVFNHARVNNGEFKAQIDKLIQYCNENGTNVIVNDYAWRNPVVSDNWIDAQKTANATVKSELQRFARETGGVYIDQQAIYGDEIIKTLNDKQEIGMTSSMTTGDNVHPNHAGHKLMAKAVVAAMGLSDYWTEEWV